MRNPLARLRFARDHRWSPDHMSDYLDGEMGPGGLERMEGHLEDCPECRALLTSLKSLVTALGGLPGRPAESVTAAVLAGVRGRLGKDDDRPS